MHDRHRIHARITVELHDFVLRVWNDEIRLSNGAALSHCLGDPLRQPDLYRPLRNLKSVQPHQSRRDIRLAWHHENRLAKSALFQHHENSRGAPNVQLRERIIEQEQRLGASVFAQRRGLEQPERDRGRALLAGRAE